MRFRGVLDLFERNVSGLFDRDSGEPFFPSQLIQVHGVAARPRRSSVKEDLHVGARSGRDEPIGDDVAAKRIPLTIGGIESPDLADGDLHARRRDARANARSLQAIED
jgi:hypothetical protein